MTGSSVYVAKGACIDEDKISIEVAQKVNGVAHKVNGAKLKVKVQNNHWVPRGCRQMGVTCIRV